MLKENPALKRQPGTWQLPSLCVLLNLYLRLAAPESKAFAKTSIQALRNFRSIPHVDGNNRGDSWGVSFGEHTEGGIWILNADGGQLASSRVFSCASGDDAQGKEAKSAGVDQ